MQKRVGGADVATIALSLVVSACGSDSHKAATDDAGSSSDETGDGGPELHLGTFCLTIAGEEDCFVYKDAAIRHPPDFEYGMAITFSSTQEPYVSLHVAEPASTTTPFVTSDLGFFLEFRGTCTTSSAMESMRCGARSA